MIQTSYHIELLAIVVPAFLPARALRLQAAVRVYPDMHGHRYRHHWIAEPVVFFGVRAKTLLS